MRLKYTGNGVVSRGVVQEPSIYGRIGSRSGGQCWQADNRVMAHRAEGSQRHVAARYRPLIVLLQHERSDEASFKKRSSKLKMR